ncbi:MAG: hypothetical protein QOH84_1841 [Kribbellaceae bacterium]|nr:hypothetical protein [Kribbellaceae bacterium]
MPAPIASHPSAFRQPPGPQPLPPVAFSTPPPAPVPIVAPAPLPPPPQVVQPPLSQVVAPPPVREPAVLPTRTGILVVARDSLPHPTARAVRFLQQAHDARDQYEAVLVAAETLAITLSVTAAALLNDRQQPGPGHTRAGNQELSALRSAYLGKGVMFGTWTSWLGSLAPLLTAHPDLVPGLRDAIADRPDTPGIVGHLNALRDERNKAAHGNKPHSRQEFALRVAELTPHLETALSQARFLEDIPWLLTVSSSFQPRSNSFQVVARRAMGDHPDFETRTFTWATPVADDVFYVLGPAGPLSLSPFIASRFCGRCSQLEVCYAYRTGKQHGPATFKSFDSGHDIPADELGDDLRSLPDRNQQ